MKEKKYLSRLAQELADHIDDSVHDAAILGEKHSTKVFGDRREIEQQCAQAVSPVKRYIAYALIGVLVVFGVTAEILFLWQGRDIVQSAIVYAIEALLMIAIVLLLPSLNAKDLL